MSPVTAPSPAPRPSRPLWRDRDYLLWFSGDVVGDLGAALRTFAMPLIAYAVTGSPARAGLVATVGIAASLVGALPGGVVVDRYDRKRLLVAGHLLHAVVHGLAAWAWWAGALRLPALLAVASASGLCSGMFGLASNAMMKHVVPTDRLPGAAAADQARQSVLGVLSDPLGGLPLGGLPLGVSVVAPFLAEATGHAVAVLTTALVRADTDPRGGARPDSGSDSATDPTGWRGIAGDLVHGWRWLATHRFVLTLVACFGIANLGASGITTALVLDWSSHGTSPQRIGLYTAGAGAAMVAGSALVPWLTRRVRNGPLLLNAMVLSAVVSAGFAVAHTDAARVVLLVLYCLPLPVLNAVGVGYVVHLIPTRSFGRVSAAIMLLNAGPTALAPWLAGHGLEVLGAPATFALMTACELVALGALACLRPLRRLGTSSQWAEQGADDAAPGPSATQG